MDFCGETVLNLDCGPAIFCLAMSHLSAPEFDGPVKRGRDEEVREIDRSSGAVAAQPGNRTVVAFKHLSDACLTVTHTTPLVDA